MKTLYQSNPGDAVAWHAKRLLLLVLVSPLVLVFPGSNSYTPIAFVLLGWATFFVMRRNNLGAGEERSIDDKAGFDVACSILAATIVLCALLLLENFRPGYFLQDDNFTQFSPLLIKAAEHFVDGGDLLKYDLTQFFGRPVYDVGVYSVAYPVSWLSYAIARMLGNAKLTIDIFCVVHLVAAAFFTCLLSRHLGISRAIAVLASCALALGGWNLTIGRSWYYVVPYALFLPMTFLGIILILEARRRTIGAILLAAGTGASIYAGNAQYWVYLNLFAILFIVILYWFSRQKSGFAQTASCALLVGYSIASFQLVPQLLLFQDILRAARELDDGTANHFLAFFLPYPFTENRYCSAPFVTGPFQNGMWGDCSELRERNVNIYSVGPVLAVAIMFYGYLFFKQKRYLNPSVVDCLFFLGLVAAWASLGKASALFIFMSNLPVFDKFGWSFKFIPFATFFLCMAGAWLIDSSVREKASRFLVISLGSVFVIWILMTSTSAIYLYKQPDLNGTGDGKGLIAFLRSFPEGAVRFHPVPAPSLRRQLLVDNYIETNGGLSSRGYDPLIEDSRQNKSLNLEDEDAQRQFGVNYVIQYRDMKLPCQKCVDLGGGYFASPVDSALPLAFIKRLDGSVVPLPFNTKGMELVVPAGVECRSGDQLVLNFLSRPRIFLTGGNGRLLTHQPDELGRIVIPNCVGAMRVTLDYGIAWFSSALVATLLVGFAIVLWWGSGRVRPDPRGR